ncbi:MAG TPA: GMC oxidoreductase [Solirubrobacteraceae bacterium]
MPKRGVLTGGWLAVFARGPDGSLGCRWQTPPDDQWTSWLELAPAVSGDPAVCANADGRLEVFASGPDGRLAHVWQLAPGRDGGWSELEVLGPVIAGRPAVGANVDGRLEVFAVGADGLLGHAWQRRDGNGWSEWMTVGGAVSGDPAVGTLESGRLEVFAVGADGLLGHSWQLRDGGGWSEWMVVGGTASGDPAVCTNADGRLEVFAAGPGGPLGHAWQLRDARGWSQWEELGPAVWGPPTVFANADGRLDVFAADPDGVLRHGWQLRDHGGWSGWEEVGTVLRGPPALFANADGRLEVFGVNAEGVLGHAWQLRGGGGWSAWDDLGPAVSGPRVAVCRIADAGGEEPEEPEERAVRASRRRQTRVGHGASSVLTADFLVIGAGPAGITVSEGLVRAGASVILAETGGFDEDRGNGDLSQGVARGPIIKGHPSYLLDGRRRQIQGAASGWGRGWLMPFRALDFAQRPWVTESGWPLTPAELAPYEARAAATFGFDVFGAPQPEGPLLRLSYHYPPDPMLFRSTYLDLLVRPHFSPELDATAVEFDVREDRIDSVRFARSDGRELRVATDTVVLAAGGIENARLLLLHERELPSGGGMLGRCFMDHPHVMAGTVRLPDAAELGSYLQLEGPALDVLALDDSLQRDERLLGASVQLRPTVGVGPDPHGPIQCDLYVRAEQAPNPESRVALSEQVDRLGIPRPVLDWRLLDQDWESIVRTVELVASALEWWHDAEPQRWIRMDKAWPAGAAGPAESMNATWGNHHLGTTRMSDRPADGVVDRDCRVHGMTNLYVAGSSVFPTGSCANPTFTIVALAHRLVDELVGR